MPLTAKPGWEQEQPSVGNAFDFNSLPLVWPAVESIREYSLTFSGHPNVHFFVSRTRDTDYPTVVIVRIDSDESTGSTPVFSMLLLNKQGMFSYPRVARDNVKRSWWKKVINGTPSAVDAASSVEVELASPTFIAKLSTLPGCKNLRFREVKDLNQCNRFMGVWEEMELLHASHHKMGLLFQLEGQSDECEMLANKEEDATEEYRQFKSWLGTEINLLDFRGYRGGLDVRKGNTGEKSLYSADVFGTHQIMFHVATLLPTSAVDTQQIEKKRHIGNDNVVIVFQQSDQCDFTSQTMTSQMCMCYVCVWPDKTQPGNFCVNLIYRRGIPSISPGLPPVSFPLNEQTRHWFLCKILNAQAACWSSPELYAKTTRMRGGELKKAFLDDK